MTSHQEHTCQYQQDEGTSGRTSVAKRYRRSDQRHHPGTGPHYREAEDQAQPRHVYHRLIDSGLPLSREYLSLAQGVTRADARRRVVGAEEDGEDPDGPAAYTHAPSFQPIGEQVDGQGYQPDQGDPNDMEPHEPSPLFYGLADAPRLWMEDLQDGEGQRRPEKDEPPQYQGLHVPPSSHLSRRATPDLRHAKPV